MGVGGAVPGQRRGHAEPGHRGSGFRQLPRGRRRGVAVVAAPGLHYRPGHPVLHERGGLRGHVAGGGRRPGPGGGHPGPPGDVRNQSQRPDREPQRLCRNAVHARHRAARYARRGRHRRFGGRRGYLDRQSAGTDRHPCAGPWLFPGTWTAAVLVLDPAGVLRARHRLAAGAAGGPRPSGRLVRGLPRCRGSPADRLLRVSPRRRRCGQLAQRRHLRRLRRHGPSVDPARQAPAHESGNPGRQHPRAAPARGRRSGRGSGTPRITPP